MVTVAAWVSAAARVWSLIGNFHMLKAWPNKQTNKPIALITSQFCESEIQTCFKISQTVGTHHPIGKNKRKYFTVLPQVKNHLVKTLSIYTYIYIFSHLNHFSCVFCCLFYLHCNLQWIVIIVMVKRISFKYSLNCNSEEAKQP